MNNAILTKGDLQYSAGHGMANLPVGRFDMAKSHLFLSNLVRQ